MGHSNVVKLLIEEDPEFTYGPNSSGRTPLYIAAERRFTDMVDMIISTCHSPAYGGFKSRTALHAAVICNDKEITEKILEWKPALTKEVDDNGWSPLHFAAKTGDDPTIVSLLLKKSDKSVVYLGTKDGKKTALHIASLHHHGKIVEELLSQFPDCSEQVDDKGHNICHFAMMEKGEYGTYLLNDWLRLRGLVNEEDGQGNTPLHLLSSNEILNYSFILSPEVDKKACNNENLTAFDIISSSRAQDITAVEKEVLLMIFRTAMNDPTAAEGLFKQINKVTQSEAFKEKYISELKHRGEAHLIVSALITTVTFAAGFTLPGGYNGDDGMAILTRKTAFRAFVVTDTIALVLSVSAVFLHFFMTVHNDETVLRKHFLWAFSFTMLGMGAMVIAFTTGLYAVLPHSSGLAIFTCILCSCFFLPFFLEFKLLGKKKNQ
ncbi:Ankyrin repeat-containing protein [Vitis vinifera]|uniref:Ankyrin repeat-containing protein n=1 Tax=Vitis vinifera TaxID=29760 RepID=A0A438GLY4_VITVI|nr:Ankyrin repeat-containing protein [Vitis vinifera]